MCPGSIKTSKGLVEYMCRGSIKTNRRDADWRKWILWYWLLLVVSTYQWKRKYITNRDECNRRMACHEKL